jgi:phage portal protein BeeE
MPAMLTQRRSYSSHNAPTFLESFEPFAHVGQARGGYGSVSPSVGIAALTSPSSAWGAESGTQRATDQVKHFTYWNYVGVRLICDRASEPFPMLSFTASKPISTAGKISTPQRQYLQQHYGWLQSAQDDLNPLPENHVFQELLNNPNPDDTWNEFAYEHFLFLNLTGKVYWWVIPNGFGLPAQIIVIPTQWVWPDYDRNGFLYQYTITPIGTTVSSFTIPEDQIIVSRLKSPWNKQDGYAPLSAAKRWSENVESIESSRWHSFRNGANPDLIVKLGEKYADPSDDVLTRIKEKFMRRASGVTKSGEPLVVPPDIEIDHWSHTPREMDYTASGDQSRDNNLALHNVPKVLAGITTDVNRATVEAAEVIFCGAKINPQLRHFAGTLTWLARRFDPRIRVWYPDVTPKNAQQELLEDQADFAMGALTPDERRQKRGREAIGEPAYESGYLPAGLSPLAEELNQPDQGIDPLTGLPIDPNADPAAVDPNSETDPNATDPKAGKGDPKAAKKQSGLTSADFDAFDLESDDAPQF